MATNYARVTGSVTDTAIRTVVRRRDNARLDISSVFVLVGSRGVAEVVIPDDMPNQPTVGDQVDLLVEVTVYNEIVQMRATAQYREPAGLLV